MFTKNYYNNIAAWIIPVDGADGNAAELTYIKYDGSTKIGGTDVPLIDCRKGSFATPNLYQLPKANMGGVIFGNGSGVASILDYKLAGDRINNDDIELQLLKVTNNTTENEKRIIYTYHITNKSSSSITISEMGICGDDYSGNILYEHTFLASPITIEPGGVGKIDYTLIAVFPDATIAQAENMTV